MREGRREVSGKGRVMLMREEAAFVYTYNNYRNSVPSGLTMAALVSTLPSKLLAWSHTARAKLYCHCVWTLFVW